MEKISPLTSFSRNDKEKFSRNDKEKFGRNDRMNILNEILQETDNNRYGCRDGQL